jgi:hypothetical protein
MFFFFKEKPIEIIAYVRDIDNSIREITPIIPARERFPTWWKNTPSSSLNWDSLLPDNTVKSCPGIIQILTAGFILPLWSDLALEYNDESYRYQFSDKQTVLSEHRNEQAPGFCENFWKLKIHSPWLISTPVKLLYTSPFYHNTTSEYPFVMPPAIIPPQVGLCGTHMFIFAKKEKSLKRVLFKNNTPILHILPMTEKNVVFRCETLSGTEFNKKESIVATKNTFNNRGLKNLFKQKQKQK